MDSAASVSDIGQARDAAQERSWVEQAVAGSKPAFEQLYRRHSGKVYALCLRMTAHRETAEDCVQETFIQAWRALPGFESRSGFGTWLHRIAVNTVLARGRRRQELLGDSAPADELAAETLHDPDVLDLGLTMDLEAAIQTLPPGARQVLVLCGVYGYSHEESAEALGIAVGTCKAQLHRARHLLSTRLGRTEADA